MNIRSSIMAMAAATVMATTAHAAPPDIVVFLADDLGAAQNGPVARSAGAKTPNIDALGKQGIVFTDGYAQPACIATRTMLMSGKWPQRRSLGAQQGKNGPQPPAGMVTIAERLRPLGYTTALVGKWHLGWSAAQHPLKQGFDHFFGFKGITPNYVGHDTAAPLFDGTRQIQNTGLVTDTLAKRAVQLITDPARTKPLFLYVAWTAPHDPLQGTLAQRINEMDAAIGRVMAAARPGTLFIYAGDNGRAKNLPLAGGKYQIQPGGVRVPVLLRWTGHVAPGQKRTTPVSLLDVSPTVVAAAGGVQTDTDGRSLLAGPSTERRIILDATGTETGFAVRKGKWIYYRSYQGVADRLHDLSLDPFEKSNVAAGNAAVVQELRSLLPAYSAALLD